MRTAFEYIRSLFAASKKQEAQRALAESIKRYEYVTKATSDAIWDRVHLEDVINWGDGFQTLFGYDINEETKLVSFWRSKVHPDDAEDVCRKIRDAKEDPSVNGWTNEYRFLKANGEYAFVKEKAIILRDSNGKATRTIGALQDVTESKQTELVLKQLNENLRESQEALVDKAVAQGKFEIASDVIHDIGNAIVGFGSHLIRIRRLQAEDNPDTIKNLSLFFEKHKTAIDAAIGEAKTNALIKMLAAMAVKQRANQEEINKSIIEQQNIVNTIEGILNIQRKYIAGFESQERKPVHIHEVVKDSISILSALMNQAGIDVSLDISGDIPAIKGDRTRLMQALINILRNSIEAIDAQAGERSIHISAFMRAGKLVLEVKDSGSGFDEVTAGQLFVKGFTTRPGGRGQGLHSARKIIESHEGTIEITSPGTGKGAFASIEFRIR